MKTMTATIPRVINITHTPINLPAETVASLVPSATHKGFTSEGKNGRHFAKRLGKFQNLNRKQKDRPKTVSVFVSDLIRQRELRLDSDGGKP